MSKTLKLGKMHRAIARDALKLDVEKRTITFPFSSELPVERWFGNEVLSHAKDACDLARFKTKAQALFNHRPDQYVGVIEDAEISSDKRGYCTVRFSKNAFADQIMKDIADEIISNVSFGYRIIEMILSKQSDTGPNEYTATKWMPYEVTFCTIPADISVGVGRSTEDIDALEIPILNQRSFAAPKQENLKMTEEEKKAADLKAAQELQIARTDAVRAERERIASINALGEKFKKPDLARQLVESGKSIEEARGAFLESIGAVQTPINQGEAMLGLDKKDIQQFSFLRAIRAMMEPNNPTFQKEAGFEREVSNATQKLTGRAARGFLVPFDILRAPMNGQRDQLVSSSTGGGNLVATNLLASSFIELLRNKSIVQQAGAMVLSGLVGNIAIPRKTTAATVYWAAENSAPTEGSVAFDQVSMSPKTVGAYVDYSRKLMLQSSLDVETLVRSDLGIGIALEIDRVALYGSGSSNQPLGLKDTSGLNTKDFAGAAPTWAEIVDLETKVNTANASELGVMKYITNAAGQGNLKTTAKSTNAALFLMDNGQVNGYPCLMSNQVASGDHWFGVWNQLMIGFWSGLDILIDPYTGGIAGTMRVIAHQDCDIAARQPTAFTRGNDTL